MGKDKVAAADAKNEIPSGNDLDQLRTILFGNQARAIEKRLNDLEIHLEDVRRELNQQFDEKIDSLAETTSNDLTKTQQSFNEQLASQANEQAKQNKELHARLDQLTADFNKQLQVAQKELSQQIDKQASDLHRKLLEFQSEARQRDDDLRLEMLALGAMLDNQKAGRNELAQMLLQMGEQLQENVKKSAVSKPDTKSK